MKASLVDHVLRRFGFSRSTHDAVGNFGALWADENLPRVRLVFDEEPWWCLMTDHHIGTVSVFNQLYTFYTGIFGRKG